MTDREKEVEWLQSEIDTVLTISDAEDWLMLPVMRTVEILKRTKGLLGEQKPVEAKTVKDSEHGSWWFACGACGHAMDAEDNFCRECGRKVKWDA